MKRAKKFPFLDIQQQRLQLSLENTSGNAIPPAHDFFIWVWQAIKSHYAHAKIGIVFLDNDTARQYNLDYRDKDYATNILSFPYDDIALSGHRTALQGDLLLCPQVIEAEAKEQNKTLLAHYAHLTVHGALHLSGYEHETDADALKMEALEIAILKQLGYPNPYL